MATETVNHGSAEERAKLILQASYQIEPLCTTLRNAVENNADALEYLTLGIIVRIAELNSAIMSAAGDEDETMNAMERLVRGWQA